MPPRVRKPPRWSCSGRIPVKSAWSPGQGLAGGSYSLRVRCYVEPSPAGGYFVRLRGEAAPLSRHDTEEEAEAAAAAYERGLARAGHGRVRAARATASEVLVRAVRPEDKPLFVAGWSQLSDESVYRRFLQPRARLSVDELAFFTEIDHVDHEAIGALDPATRRGRRRRALRARARAPARRRGRRDRRRRVAAPRARRQAAAAAVRARDREPHPGLHRVAAGRPTTRC